MTVDLEFQSPNVFEVLNSAERFGATLGPTHLRFDRFSL
jgi:hypothetical protein